MIRQLGDAIKERGYHIIFKPEHGHLILRVFHIADCDLLMQ